MQLNEYQERAMTTCMPSCANFSYMGWNLVGEIGELASKVAKAIRKEQVCIGCRDHINALMYAEDLSEKEMEDFQTELKKEIGDVLWQVAGLCKSFGWPLEEIAQMNLDKLASRQKRGVIDGNGDNR